MQTFIFVTLIVLGVATGNWRQSEYSQWTVPQGQTFRRGPVRNVYHQNGFSQWNPQQYYSEQNINVHESFAIAEWICRNPKTGDMLIIVSETKDQNKDQKEDQRKESFHNSEQDQNTWNQRNPTSHKFEDIIKENDMKNNGGEGLIDVRIGV
ncbi:uncharacterized protein LOC124949595 [Vespa velutina]|uniref:uncharacterized protein LOC124949595 n=1 Tax=Vespa velutina TaxID=202808 RepID=UPI001FB48497|nr:uncharacterized protein LOC124949595 [Vespa velutina]